MKYLVDIAPRKEEMMRSDGDGEFEGEFVALCTREKIKRELTTDDTPEQNGVVVVC